MLQEYPGYDFRGGYLPQHDIDADYKGLAELVRDTRAGMRVPAHVRVHVCVHVCMCSCMCVCMCSCMCVCMCVCMPRARRLAARKQLRCTLE